MRFGVPLTELSPANARDQLRVAWRGPCGRKGRDTQKSQLHSAVSWPLALLKTTGPRSRASLINTGTQAPPGSRYRAALCDVVRNGHQSFGKPAGIARSKKSTEAPRPSLPFSVTVGVCH